VENLDLKTYLTPKMRILTIFFFDRPVKKSWPNWTSYPTGAGRRRVFISRLQDVETNEIYLNQIWCPTFYAVRRKL